MTGLELAAAVGALMDIGVPSGSTNPTDDDIYDWLNLAQKMLVKNSIDEDLKELLEGYIFTAIADTTYTIPCASLDTYEVGSTSTYVPVVRVVSVWTGGEPVAFRPRFVFDQEIASGNFGTDKRVWTYEEPRAYSINETPDPDVVTPHVTRVSIYPSVDTDETVILRYIRHPADISSSSGTGSTAKHTLSEAYDDVLVLFATALAKIQDEEMADAQYLLQVSGIISGRTGSPIPPKGA